MILCSMGWCLQPKWSGLYLHGHLGHRSECACNLERPFSKTAEILLDLALVFPGRGSGFPVVLHGFLEGVLPEVSLEDLLGLAKDLVGLPNIAGNFI